jgi:hypothetical protein
MLKHKPDNPRNLFVPVLSLLETSAAVQSVVFIRVSDFISDRWGGE